MAARENELRNFEANRARKGAARREKQSSQDEYRRNNVATDQVKMSDLAKLTALSVWIGFIFFGSMGCVLFLRWQQDKEKKA